MAEFKGNFGKYGFDPEKDKQRTFAKDVVDTIKGIPGRILGGITTSGYGEKSTWYNQPKVGDQDIASDIKKRTAGGAGGNNTATIGTQATINPANNQATATNSPVNYDAFDTTGKLGTQVPTPFESTSPTAVGAMQQMKDAIPAGETNIRFDLTDPKYQEARDQVFGPQQPLLPGAQEGTTFGGSPNQVSDNVLSKLDQRSRAYYALGGGPAGPITGTGAISNDPATIQAAQAIGGRTYGSDTYGNSTEFRDRLSSFRADRQKDIDAQRARFDRADARRGQLAQQKQVGEDLKLRNQAMSNIQTALDQGKISARAAYGIIQDLIGNPRGEGIQAQTAANQLGETARSNRANEAYNRANLNRQTLNDQLDYDATLRGQEAAQQTAMYKEQEALRRLGIENAYKTQAAETKFGYDAVLRNMQDQASMDRQREELKSLTDRANLTAQSKVMEQAASTGRNEATISQKDRGSLRSMAAELGIDPSTPEGAIRYRELAKQLGNY